MAARREGVVGDWQVDAWAFAIWHGTCRMDSVEIWIRRRRGVWRSTLIRHHLVSSGKL